MFLANDVPVGLAALLKDFTQHGGTAELSRYLGRNSQLQFLRVAADIWRAIKCKINSTVAMLVDVCCLMTVFLELAAEVHYFDAGRRDTLVNHDSTNIMIL